MTRSYLCNNMHQVQLFHFQKKLIITARYYIILGFPCHQAINLANQSFYQDTMAAFELDLAAAKFSFVYEANFLMETNSSNITYFNNKIQA